MQQIIDVFNLKLFTLLEHDFTLGELIVAPALVLAGILLTKILINMIVKKLISNGSNADMVHLVRRVASVLAIILLTITILDFLNVPITAFAFLSGAIAIGFGFGAQNIINNFISGWILIWERPIKIGDFLEVENAKGIVEEINTRSTRVRRTDGVHMLIPNSKLLENTVINWTLIDTRARSTLSIGVAYGSPVKLVAALLEQSVKEQPEVLTNPKPTIIFDDFGDNALMFVAYFWLNANVEGDMRLVKSNIRFRIDELFTEHNIVIAYPQRDVHLDGQLRVISTDQADTKEET
ncbi:mechanosensitive ion channel [Paraglaciecola aquimarina]|uniref:Mechanosensitive ion channel n=1 Tax=Paraglaciecola aquimarina TaxID=1235557 RepID=A0ABU3SY20_9ALTE|nr:mechanosensitive ion channel domain-containing protein [Paraglaciecola aquimarina]MDU0354915.1 mechanosensitive ion channel [Paraglaciecola aquimarina]